MLGPRGILNLVRASHSQTSISKGGMYMRMRDAGLIQPKANHKMWVNCIFRDAVSVWPVRRFLLLRFHGVLCSGIFKSFLAAFAASTTRFTVLRDTPAVLAMFLSLKPRCFSRRISRYLVMWPPLENPSRHCDGLSHYRVILDRLWGGSVRPERWLRIFRKGGSLAPDWWLKVRRNNQWEGEKLKKLILTLCDKMGMYI